MTHLSIPEHLRFLPGIAIKKSRADRREMQRAAAKLMRANGLPKASALLGARNAVSAVASERVFLSPLYQVLIRDYGQLQAHISVKRIDKEPIYSRSDLVAIAERFAHPETVAVELYPAESRVVDTANQFHLWSLPRAVGGIDLTQACASACSTGQQAGQGWRVQALSLGAERDWREVMRIKRGMFGAEVEAIDILAPTSALRGPCLLVVDEPGFRFQFGWNQGLRTDHSLASASQRPGAEL